MLLHIHCILNATKDNLDQLLPVDSTDIAQGLSMGYFHMIARIWFINEQEKL